VEIIRLLKPVLYFVIVGAHFKCLLKFAIDPQMDGFLVPAQAFEGRVPCAGDAFYKTLTKASLKIMVIASAISFLF